MRNKQSKAVRQYERLMNQNTDTKNETKTDKIVKINKRLTRISEINHLNVMIILKEYKKIYEYFTELDNLIESSGRIHASHELKIRLKEANVKDSSGVNSLLLAVLNNSYELFELLITHGVDMKQIYTGERTLLHVAVSLNNFHIAKLILDFENYIDQLSKNNPVTLIILNKTS